MKGKTTFLAKAFLMLFAMLFSLTSARAQQALPYEYGFETALDVDGWTTVDCHTSTGIITGAKQNGDYGFQFYYNTNPPQYLVSPELTGTEGGVAVTFSYKNPTSYTETFKVGYSTTTMDPDAFTWDTEITAPSDWTVYEGTFPAGTKFVAVAYTANDQFKMYLDDFSFTVPAAVAKPTGLKVSYTGGTTATVSWSSDASAFDIDVNDVVTENVGNPYNMTGLSLGTTYTIKVRAKEGTDVSDWTAPVSFTTDFPALSLPYTDGFEDGIAAWTLVDCASGTGIVTKAQTGEKGFGFKYSSNPPQYLISPEFDGASAMTVSFWYAVASESWPETFQVGYSTTTKDVDAFTWGDEVTATNTSEWLKYEADFPAGTKFVAVRYNSNNMYYLYLDDFKFTVASAYPKPKSLAVSYTGDDTAVVTWTGEATSYDIDVNGTITEGVNSPYTLTGLLLSGTYEVKVRANYGSGNYSDWTDPVSFQTNDCMNADMCYITYELKVTSGYEQYGWYGSYLLVYNNVNGDDTDELLDYWTVPQNDADGTVTGGLQLCPGTSLRFEWYSANANNDALLIDQIIVKDADQEDIINISGPLSEKVYYTMDCTISEFKKPTDLAADEIGNNYATLSWTENGTATSWIVAYMPEGKDFTEVLAKENPFTLNGLTPETTYTVKVRPDTDEVEKWSAEITFTTDIATAAPTGLAANADVTTADVNWNGSADSYNLRYAIKNTVVFEDFENTENNALPDGWTSIDADGDGQTWYTFTPDSPNDNQGNPTVFDATCATSASYASSTALTPDNWLISPQIDLASTLSLWVRGQDPSWAGEHFAIYLSTEAAIADVSDFTVELVPETVATGEYVEFTADLSAYAGQKGYIGIRHFNCTDMFRLNVDNFAIYEMGEWVTVNDVTSPYTIDGLAEETTYEVQVQGVYGSDESTWASTTFTTLSSNPVPSNIEADLAADGATLTWDGIGDSYNVQYRTPAADNPLFEADFSNGWTIYTEGDAAGAWTLNSGSMVAHSWVNGTGALDADNWLISPAVELNGTLKFTVGVENAYADSYEVLLSTTGIDIADFTETLQAMAPGSDGQKVSIDLSAYAGQTGYIAIHHVDNDMNYLAISDFGIYGEPIPAGAWESMAVTGTTATISGLATNNAYEYQIQSVKGANVSAWSDVADFALLTLANDADNTSLVNSFNGYLAHVTLADRTLYQDGTWNTICLPFDLDATEFAASPLAGADLRTLQSIAVDDANNATLNFTDAGYFDTKGLWGGFPFIIKWTSGSNIENPEFANVIITSSKYTLDYDAQTTSGTDVTIAFKGTYAPMAFTDTDKSILFVGASNVLNYPMAGATIKSQRAYFQLENAEAADGLSPIKQFIMNLGDDDATGISELSENSENSEAWYDLSGRKLAGKPAVKGIYVNGGRKVTVK